jgi:hypothetical protein
MPVTPDLKPNEVEVTMPCPVAGCKAVTTCAWHESAKEQMGFVKNRQRQLMIKSHNEGKHSVKQ